MLYKHQIKIIEEDKNKTGIWTSTGSGKTLTTLCLARGIVLVIAPKTTVEDKTWEREIEKSKLKHIKNIKVISKETFRRDWNLLDKFDTLIIDEAHTVLGATPNIRWKNKKPIPKTSQLFEAVENYIAKTNPERIYLVTATIVRNPMVVWAASRILGRNWDFYAWRQAFYIKLPIPHREVWVPKKDKETKERLAKAVQGLGYVGRLEDYVDVPPQTFKTVFLELTKEQKDRIKELHIEYPEPIVQVGKIHQVDQGVLTGDEFNKPESFKNEKIDKIVDYTYEFPKIVIFARYTAQIEAIRIAVESTGKKCLILQGSTKNRGEVILEANNMDECVLICQSTISAGWEVPSFPVMIFASLDWSVVSYVQSIGRINRINNLKKNLYIHLVVKGSVDEKVYKSIVEYKMDFLEATYQKYDKERS